VGEEQGKAAMARIEAGATGFVHLEKWGGEPPAFLPLANARKK